MVLLRKPQKTSPRFLKDLKAPSALKPAARVYQFDSFVLDQAERVLLRGGQPVALTAKVFDVLSVLVESAGHVVTKATLLEKIWPDAFVEEANLTVNVAVLRKILRQNAGGKQYIETVPKQGYRFVAKVLEVKGERALQRVEQEIALTVQQESALNSFQAFSSLAVLPFDNESGDPDTEYLADGLTESIINSLSHVEDFRVLARNTVFRYKPKSADPQRIGEELGVRSLLTGRILRLGDRVIIRATAIDVQEGWQIWGEQYHRTLSDMLVVQEEIAKEISAKLKLKLTADEKRRLTKRYTDNPAAYHFYLKGRYHWNKYAHKDLGKAIGYFRSAIEEDPVYALAYAGLSDSYCRLSNLYSPATEAMPKAKSAAHRALEIDETLAEAHAALGSALMFYDWDWPAAKREFLRAIELNPGYAIAHQRLAQYFNLAGCFAEAMHEYQIALDLDPLSPSISSSAALEFFLLGDYEQAIEQAEKTLAIDPNYPPTYYLVGWIHKRSGELAKAVDTFERVTMLDDSSLYLAALAHAYGLNGDHTKAVAILDQLEERAKHQYVSPYSRALIYIGLGENDLAFQWLDKAFEERSEMIPYLRIGVDCDSLRADPRFHDLLRRCGLEIERQ